MKTKTKITSMIVIALSCLLTFKIAIAQDVIVSTKTIFTPERSGIQYVAGMLGFNYPSFNNYIGNPNIPGAWQNDERRFFVGKYCGQSTVGCENKTYLNTVPHSEYLQENDIVRFAIYFHNNQKDPSEVSSNETYEWATNVNMGIDLAHANLQDTEIYNVIRPLGFIYSAKNRYIRNNSTLTYSTGDYIFETNSTVGSVAHTASDDMQVKLGDLDLKLVPIPNSTQIIGGVGTDYVITPITSPNTPVNFHEYTVYVTPHTTEDRMWVTFDKFPGCFKYSGWVVFDAIAVKPPPPEIDCGILRIERDPNPVMNAVQGEALYRIYVDQFNFENTDSIPAGTQIEWRADNPNGQFYRKSGNQYIFAGTGVVQLPESYREIYYAADATTTEIEATVRTPFDPSLEDEKNCVDEVLIPPYTPPDNVCESLSATYQQVTIGTEDALEMRVTNIDFLTNQFPPGTRVRYSSSDPTGEFKYQYNIPAATGSLTLPENIPYQTVYYFGDEEATITVELTGIDPELANPSVCFAEFPFEPTPPPENVCLSLGAHTDLDNTQMYQGKVLYPIYYDGLFFSQGIPAGTEILWESDDPEGVFYTLPNYIEHPDSITTDPTDPSFTGMYYSGTGPVHAELINVPSDVIITEDCEATILITPPDNVCISLTATDFNLLETVTIQGETAYKLQVTDTVFAPVDELPAGTRALWTAEDDEDGEFWIYSTALDAYVRASGINSASVSLNQPVYFIGSGTVSVQLTGIPEDQANPAKCSAVFEITPVEEPVCVDIKIDHQDPIWAGTLSEFRAIAYDSDGNVYGETITYSVDNGYGFFYTEENKPSEEEVPSNNSPMVYEIPVVYILPVTPFGAIEPTPQMLSPEVLQNFSQSVANGSFFEINTITDKEIVIPSIESAKQLQTPRKPLIPSSYGQTQVLDLQPTLFQETIGIMPDLYFPQVGLDPSLVPDLYNMDIPGSYYAAAIGGTSSITVPHGETVYFEALQPGDGVIHVQATDTDVPECSEDFDIEEVIIPPSTCTYGNLLVTDLDNNQTAVCLEPNTTYSLRALFYDQNNALIGFDRVVVGWTTTDPDGRFYTVSQYLQSLLPGGSLPAGTNEIITNGNLVFYVGGGQVMAKLTGLDGEPYTLPLCFDIIEPCENECASLELVSRVPDPLYVGEASFLTLITEDLNGDPLPPETRLIWNAVSTGGELLDSQGNNPSQTLSILHSILANIPVRFQNSILPGTVSVSIHPDDPLYSEVCSDFITVVAPFECITLNPVIQEVIYPAREAVLEPNNIYEVSASPDYSDKDYTGEVTYEIHPLYGAFLELPDRISDIILTTLGNEDLTRLNFRNFVLQHNLEDAVSTSVTKEDGESVYLIIYSDAPESMDDALKIWAVGYEDPCYADFPVEVPAPPEEEMECIDLDIITPDHPWMVEEDDDNIQLFQIEVDTDPEGEYDELYYHWEVVAGAGEWQDDDELVVEQGGIIQVLEDFDEDTEVQVWASYEEDGDPIEVCQDSISARVEDDIEPDIEKYVYLRGEPEDADDLLNIGDNSIDDYEYLTYVAKYTVGSEQWVEIREREFEEGTLYGSEWGEFIYEEMRINVDDENGDEYTILETDGYEDDDDDDDFEDLDDMEEYEDAYRCEGGTEEDRVCIDSNNFDAAADNFLDKEPIRFENLRPGTKIYIKVQVRNESRIDDEYCKEMDVEEGCGEEFINEVYFETDPESGYEGEDDTKVIVICPYIITRQAGDVFFYDAIDTGIDVAYCSPVKGTTGVTITPEPIEPTLVTKTGEGPLPEEAVLLVPTHDICAYSNLEGGIEGYSNVLENFSSTVCEMRAEVAEQWKEENINSAIAANIERIARWESNLKDTESISTMEISLGSLKNSQSGVFVKDNGPLKINLTGKIGAVEGKVPAGQTYIIIGHDLEIDSDILYGETDYTNPDKIPSAAFIVIDGNIVINNDVGQIDGILMAVDLDGDGEDGKVLGGTDKTKNRLTINGSLIGNVFDLFSKRVGVGDPTRDEGSVTVRYDERILLNTPPGLGELINVSQSIVP